MQFDWTVGQILKALKRFKLTDNTLIILTSDNGPVLDDGYMDRAVELVGSHTPAGPFRGGKYSAFEGGTAVPFIVCWPGHTPKGKVSDALVSHIDDFVSLGSLLGATLPEGTAPDSRNFLATWLGQEDTSRPFVVEQAADHTLSIFDGEWKYITPSNGPKEAWETHIETGYLPVPQLYNIKEDNGEHQNCADSNPTEVTRLQDMLTKVRARELK